MTTLYEVQFTTPDNLSWRPAVVGAKDARFGEIETARYPTRDEAQSFLDHVLGRRAKGQTDRLGREWRIAAVKTKHCFVYDPFRKTDETGRTMRGVNRWIWIGEFPNREAAIDAAAEYGIEYEDRVRLKPSKEHRPKGAAGIPYSSTIFDPDRAGVRRIVGRLVGSSRR